MRKRWISAGRLDLVVDALTHSEKGSASPWGRRRGRRGCKQKGFFFLDLDIQNTLRHLPSVFVCYGSESCDDNSVTGSCGVGRADSGGTNGNNAIKNLFCFNPTSALKAYFPLSEAELRPAGLQDAACGEIHCSNKQRSPTGSNISALNEAEPS